MILIDIDKVANQKLGVSVAIYLSEHPTLLLSILELLAAFSLLKKM